MTVLDMETEQKKEHLDSISSGLEDISNGLYKGKYKEWSSMSDWSGQLSSSMLCCHACFVLIMLILCLQFCYHTFKVMYRNEAGTAPPSPSPSLFIFTVR